MLAISGIKAPRALQWRKLAPSGARAALVVFIALTIATSLPMSSPPAEGARILSTFADGSESLTIEFTSVPQPGEYLTYYIKLKPDVTVMEAYVNVSAIIFELGHEYTGTGLVGLSAALDLSGDINGDGLTDLLITALSAGNNEGLVIGVWGSAAGIILPQDLTITGSAQNEFLGFSGSTTGSLNGDRFADVVVGGVEMDFSDPPSATGPGKVNLYWGAARPNTTADLSRSGATDGDLFGWSVSTSGDIDDNGRDDLVVGAPRHILNTDDPGLAYVYLSGASGPGTTANQTLTGADDGDAFGYKVSICGDVNDDGYDDVLVGAPSHNSTTDFDVGKAYLYLGSSTGVSTTASWTYTGGAQEDFLGYAVAGIGDVNDDGYDDIAVGAPGADPSGTNGAGAVYVFYGSASGPKATPDVTIEGEAGNMALGVSIAPLGDANGDAIDDFYIGAPDLDNGTLTSAGAAYIHFGGPSGVPSTPHIVKKGPRADGDYGVTLAAGGDCNGDGYSDLTIGDTTLNWMYSNYGSGGISSPEVLFDTTPIISHSGMLYGTKRSSDFSAMANAYLAAHSTEVDENGYVSIPLSVTSGSIGKMRMHDLRVLFYKLNDPVNLKGQALPRGNAVELSWDPQIGDDTTSVAIEMWDGSAWTEVKKVSRAYTSHVIEGVQDGVELEYRIRAYDGGVQRYSNPSNTVKVTPMDTLAPAKVINFTYKSDTPAQGINLTWNPTDPDTVHYEVWSNKTGAWAVLANVSAPDTWYLDTDIDDGPKYWYRVRAWDEVPQAGEASVTIAGILEDTTKPAIPTGLHAEAVPEGNGLRVTWDLNTDDTVSYSLHSNKTGEWREIVKLGRATGDYIDRGLVDGVRYYYRIMAEDESDNPSNFTSPVWGVPKDTVPPARPIGVTAAPRAVGNTLRVAWTPNIDDTVSYRIYILHTSTWDLLAEVPEASEYYDAIDLVDGQAFQLRVTAVDDAGLESAPSDAASGTPGDTQFPSIPTGLRLALVPEGSAVNISWASNYDDTVEYKVYRLEGSTWTMIATLTDGTTWFMDTGLTNGMPYAYVVTAIDEVGNESPFSERKEAVPLDTVAPPKPVFIGMPSKVRDKDLKVVGRCEVGAKITIHVNKLSQPEVVCNETGHFTLQVRLRSGSNEVYAVAKDGSGISVDGDRMTVFVDEMPPGILSSSPANGDVQIDPEGLVLEYTFTEDIMSSKLVVVLIEGRLTDYTKIMDALSKPGTIPTAMLSYMREDLLATFNITSQLKYGKAYTVVLKGLEDVAGNPQATEGNLGLWAFSFTTSGSGPVGPDGDGDGGGGISSGVLWSILALIIIIVVIVVFVFVMRSGARGETVEVERGVVGGSRPEPTAEESRPDVQDLYKQAYDERGGEVEKHEVDAGLGGWLAAQEQASKQADEETKRLVAEMAKQPAPPAESGPIEMVPPGLAEELAAKAEAERAAEAAEAEAEAEKAAEATEAETKAKEA